MKTLFFIGLLLLIPPTSVNAQDQAWIVLDFTLRDGTPAQMAFNNPAYTDITESECKKSLPNIQQSLVKAAIQKEARFATAKFLGAHCVMSTGDPLKPK